MSTIKVGDKVNWLDSWGTAPAKEAVIEGIELCENEGDKYGDVVESVSIEDKNRCCFTLTNGKWAYCNQIDTRL